MNCRKKSWKQSEIAQCKYYITNMESNENLPFFIGKFSKTFFRGIDETAKGKNEKSTIQEYNERLMNEKKEFGISKNK